MTGGQAQARGLKNGEGLPLKVLVVEDETIVALTLREALEEMGCVVTAWANSASEAARLAASNPPDLVLMDIRLRGGADGVEAALQLHQGYRAPVVFMTGFAEQERVAEASELSPVRVLLKPFTPDDLKKVMLAACGGTG